MMQNRGRKSIENYLNIEIFALRCISVLNLRTSTLEWIRIEIDTMKLTYTDGNIMNFLLMRTEN